MEGKRYRFIYLVLQLYNLDKLRKHRYIPKQKEYNLQSRSLREDTFLTSFQTVTESTYIGVEYVSLISRNTAVILFLKL